MRTLKRALRAQRVTYADVAKHLGVSLATVKRLFHRGDLTLSRLEQIGDLAGLELTELVENMATEETLVSELERDQERELIADPKLLLVCYLLIHRWELAQITEHFQVEPDEAKKLLRRLRDLKLIEILPFDRIKVLTARNFKWRADGPVQRYFLEQVRRDFFGARFDGVSEVLYLLAGLMSNASRRRAERSMQRLAAEINELSKADAKLPKNEREPFGAVIALRSWEFSAFTALRRSTGSATLAKRGKGVTR
jgi:transcriptional regulator with XRE-family HTH domain